MSDQTKELQDYDAFSAEATTTAPASSVKQKVFSRVAKIIGYLSGQIIGLVMNKEYRILIIPIFIIVILRGLWDVLCWSATHWNVVVSGLILLAVWKLSKKVRILYQREIQKSNLKDK